MRIALRFSTRDALRQAALIKNQLRIELATLREQLAELRTENEALKTQRGERRAEFTTETQHG